MIRLIGFLLRWTFRLILLLIVGAVALWIFSPREPVDLTVQFEPEAIGEDVEAYLESEEAEYDDIVDGVRKRVVWDGAEGETTEWSVVYVHGFSASSEELRPVPDEVAEALDANLFFTRLAGHGRDAEAMAEPAAGDWVEDMAEALAVGRQIGDRVLVISTSTGGTLAAAAAVRGGDLTEDVAGMAFVSPNFRLQPAAARLLTVPGAEFVLPVVAGRERGFTPLNEKHARYWTETYPSAALFPMAALVRKVRQLDFAQAQVPALFLFDDDDQIVDPAETRDIATEWGGPAILAPQQVPEGGDPMHHVIAGDILSPRMTPIVVEQIVGWARGL